MIQHAVFLLPHIFISLSDSSTCPSCDSQCQYQLTHPLTHSLIPSPRLLDVLLLRFTGFKSPQRGAAPPRLLLPGPRTVAADGQLRLRGPPHPPAAAAGAQEHGEAGGAGVQSDRDGQWRCLALMGPVKGSSGDALPC